jgi:pyruvate,water dikinase
VDGGTEQRQVESPRASQASLTGEQAGLVAETAVAVERHYGRPMDVEFAFDGEGRFYLLQARPITTH